jgi:hypothetical protein
MFSIVTSHKERCGFLADEPCSLSGISLTPVYFYEKSVLQISFWEINNGVLCKTAHITALPSTGYLYLMNPFVMKHLICHTCALHIITCI